jgi:hypothetical protein
MAAVLDLLHSATDLLAVLPLSDAPVDPAPEPEDVKAGWTAFAIFGLLALSVALLGWSLVRQLRKADDARKRGVYGDEPEVPAQAAAAPETTEQS